MSCGPPDTLRNRTVVPGLIVSLAGSNAAAVVPLPVIFTSTTAPAGSAAGAFAATPAGAGVAASAWDAADFLSPPQATIANATSEVNRVKRIADSLRDGITKSACERVHNISPLPQNGSPAHLLTVAFSHHPDDTDAHAGAARPAHPGCRSRASPGSGRTRAAARRPLGGAGRAGARHPRRDTRFPRPRLIAVVRARVARAAAPRPRRPSGGDLRGPQLQRPGHQLPARAGVRRGLRGGGGGGGGKRPTPPPPLLLPPARGPEPRRTRSPRGAAPSGR